MWSYLSDDISIDCKLEVVQLFNTYSKWRDK